MSKGGSETVTQADGVYTAWVIMSPADDVPGAWIAHALEFDVVTQGKDARHAYAMVVEAVSLFLDDALRRGVSPLGRRAPAECWQPLLEMFAHGERVDSSTFMARLTNAEPSETFAVQMVWLTGHKHVSSDEAVAPPVAFTAPNAHTC